jgi:PAS domain S-box-containing protein
MELTKSVNFPAGPQSSAATNITFRLLVDQITDYAIFLLTPEGDVATWNPGAQRIKGYEPEEIIGRHFRAFYSSQAQDAKIPEQELIVAAAEGRFEDEGWRLRKDGSRFWANVIITAIRNASGELVGYGKVTRDLTERKKAEEQLRELSHYLLKMQDEERGRLGRELHDTVGQYLVAIKMSLDGLISETVFDEAQVRQRLGESLSLVERTVREVRTLSYLLYPPMLDEQGLNAAIRWHLEGFSKRSGIHTTYEIPGDIYLPKDTELALFRVLQESLTNIHRHSHSSTAEVRFTEADHIAVLEVKDQGKGISLEQGQLTASSIGKLGVGVRGMSERLRQLGGTLAITSDSHGTTVKASVPIDRQSASLSSGLTERHPHAD